MNIRIIVKVVKFYENGFIIIILGIIFQGLKIALCTEMNIRVNWKVLVRSNLVASVFRLAICLNKYAYFS